MRVKNKSEFLVNAVTSTQFETCYFLSLSKPRTSQQFQTPISFKAV